MLSHAVTCELSAGSDALLRAIGVESTSDLANLWTGEWEVFNSVANPALCREITSAWKVARVCENIRLDKVQPPQTVEGRVPRPVPPASLALRHRRVDRHHVSSCAGHGLRERGVRPTDPKASRPSFDRKLQHVSVEALRGYRRALSAGLFVMLAAVLRMFPTGDPPPGVCGLEMVAGVSRRHFQSWTA